MASRADYLSKYLSKDDTKKSKKKSKKTTSHQEKVLPILIEGLGVFGNDAGHTNNEFISGSNAIKATLPDPEDEFEPTNVDLGPATKAKKGFKRIDNGELVMNEKLDHVAAPEDENPTTIYRDQSGKIVDLQAKRAEIKARQESEAEREKIETDRVNTGELDRVRREKESKELAKATRFDYSKDSSEYAQHISRKDRFEDPMFGRLSTTLPSQPERISDTGRPIYDKGPHPENRFKIKAGHFWDGIDRGNGFEERLVRARDLIYVKKVTDRGAKESYTEYDFE